MIYIFFSISHLQYSFTVQESYENDIAVLQMAQPVDFAPNALPICLPNTDDLLIGRIGK